MKYENEREKRKYKLLYTLRNKIRMLKKHRRKNHEDKNKKNKLTKIIDKNYKYIEIVNNMIKD